MVRATAQIDGSVHHAHSFIPGVCPPQRSSTRRYPCGAWLLPVVGWLLRRPGVGSLARPSRLLRCRLALERIDRGNRQDYSEAPMGLARWAVRWYPRTYRAADPADGLTAGTV